MLAFIFDIDGTLVDSNELHVDSWDRAFRRFGKQFPREKLRAQIGKGSDQYLPEFLTPDEIDRFGKELGGISPADAVTAGDTRFDIEAARKAGLKTIAFLCGGTSGSVLREAGAIAIYSDPADFLAHYDELIKGFMSESIRRHI